jgi:hypothetical protein
MKHWLIGEARALGKGWNHFWFDSRSNDSVAGLCLFRLCFGAVMLVFYFSRALDLEFFYGENGILPLGHLQAMESSQWHPTIFTWITSLPALHAFHSVFLLGLLSLTLGFYTRLVAPLVYLLHLMFINRNPTVLFGVDTIGTFFFLYLCFADSGARLSLDARRGRAVRDHGPTSHVAWRLMQIQVCVIYAYSGFEKLKGIRWWDGSALWDVLSIGNMQRWDLSFVAHFPILLAGAVYLLLLWEIYFAALIWVPRLRVPVLAFGVFLHVGIVLFMNLPSFGLLMIATYVLFLKEREVQRGLSLLPRGLHPQRSSR